MGEIILQVENLSFAYPNQQAVLENISFQIEKGTKVFLHGRNGAGKTTLFQCINGLLKIKNDAIRYAGKVIKKESERMRLISIVFQNVDDQIIAGSVFDEVAFGVLNQGLSDTEVQTRVESALQSTNIEHLRDKPPHFLSHGEKKQVVITSVLAMQPEMIILDEPTAGLDAIQTEELIDLLNQLARNDCTLLISTHDSDFSFQCADHVIVIDQGKIIDEGAPESVFSHTETLRKAGVRKPMMMQLHECLVGCAMIKSEPIPKNMQQLRAILNKTVYNGSVTKVETNDRLQPPHGQ